MAIAPAGLVGGFAELEIRNKVDLDQVLKSQQDLYHSQVDQLRDVFINQCRLTGVNPLSQEMAAGALSIKLGKRPRNMLNPKAIKHLQMIFSIKDEVKTREGREIAALCKITVSQVRDYFANHRAKMRKIICSARKKTKIPDPSSGHSVQASLTTDQSVSEMAAVDTVVPSVPGENSGNNTNGELVQVSENTINSGTAQVGQQCSVDSTVIQTVEESPSCSMQEETIDGISSDDKKFVENIFNLMRKEETFSGQTKLMEWVLKICDLFVLQWFVTKGGLPILATWLSEAAAEEQTTLLLVIFKVFEHLPLEKALPVQVKEILQTVNTLRFYRTSDVPNRAKTLLLRWSKQFLRNHAEKKQSLMGSKEAQQELMDIPEEILAIEGIRDMINQSEPMRGQKLLQLSGESSKITNGSGSSTKTTKPETKLRRKVKLVEQPDRRSPSKNAQVARAVPSNQSRPMSADDIQKAKMHNLFMKNKYGKDTASPSELPKSKDCQLQPTTKIKAEVTARKSPLPHSRRDEITEPARERTQITRRDERTTVTRDGHMEAAKQTSQATKKDDRTEPAKETSQITRSVKCITTRDERTESAKETIHISRDERTTTRDERTESAKETTHISRDDRTTTRDEPTESAKETTHISRDERTTTRDERMESAKATTQITCRDERTTTTRDERMEGTKQTTQATKWDEHTDPAKQTSQATRMDKHKEHAKQISQTEIREERTEPAKETSQITELSKNQFKWQIPPVMQIDSVWRIGTGENSKEVLVQNQRNRRAKEIFCTTFRDVPPNPSDPWDMEMDYDDSLTPEIPIEPPHEADFIDVSHDNRVDNNLTPVPVPVPAPAPTVVPVTGAEPDMELLAVLLKNPELVFALTSEEQGSNLISQETMALLDTLKNSGQGLTGLLTGAAATGGSALPSPSPSPSDTSTASWSSAFPMQPTTRVMQTHFLAHPQPPGSLGLPHPAPTTVFSSHQLTVTVNPASQLSRRPPTSVQQKVTLPPSSSNPSHRQHVIQGPLPRASHPALLPTLTPTVPHPQLLAEPPMFQPRAPSWPDHRDSAARGLYEAPAHNTYHPANPAECSYYTRGHLHPGQAVERYSIPAGPFLETWSPERSSVRPQEVRAGPQRKDGHRHRRPEFSRQWSSERRDWNRDRDRDRDRSGGRDRGRHWPDGSRWHDRERDHGRR